MDPGDLSEARVAEMIFGVAAYMRQERNLYFPASELLAPAWRTAVQPYSRTLCLTPSELWFSRESASRPRLFIRKP